MKISHGSSEIEMSVFDRHENAVNETEQVEGKLKTCSLGPLDQRVSPSGKKVKFSEYFHHNVVVYQVSVS